MRWLLHLCVSIFLCSSCNSVQNYDTNSSRPSTDLHRVAQNKVYLFSPSKEFVVSNKEPGCDCCTSHLLLKDSGFIFISYCVDGDTFFKGRISRKGNDLLLHFDSLRVTQSFGFVSDTSYEVNTAAPTTATLREEREGSKPLMVYTDQHGKEYGREEDSTALSAIRQRLNSDSIRIKLKLANPPHIFKQG